jgi:8-oxo-dGTP diphosphatase
MRSFRVGGGLIVIDNQLLLAANRRRQGTLEWTPPGGVIDHGESVTSGITREVHEETGLRVATWHERHYTVSVEAADLGWLMSVEAWLATSAHGEIALNDPDGIVEQAAFFDLTEVEFLLADSPLWVRVPLMTWINGGMRPIGPFAFTVIGNDRSTARVEQLPPVQP